ncbi:MAG: DUF1800 family protein, partial [Dehalococcoidia bacterium]|nr:DUF1800 family protein [Dehalococcoidia bacterium]
MPFSTDRRSAGRVAVATVAAAPQGEHTPLPQAVSGVTVPPPEVIALHKLTYGPRPGDIERVRAMGVRAFIEEQLNPDAIDDGALNARVAAAGFQLLDAPIPTLWARQSLTDGHERDRAWRELRHLTWLRALFSRRQL